MKSVRDKWPIIVRRDTLVKFQSFRCWRSWNKWQSCRYFTQRDDICWKSFRVSEKGLSSSQISSSVLVKLQNLLFLSQHQMLQLILSNSQRQSKQKMNLELYRSILIYSLYNRALNSEYKLTFSKTTSMDNPLFSGLWDHLHSKNDYRRREMERLLTKSYIFTAAFIVFIILASIIFTIGMCIRMICFSPIEKVGTWKTLVEEAKV